MSVWLVVLWWYLGVGAINYTMFAARGNSLLFSYPFSGKGRIVEGIVEAAFYVLLWWVQLLWWMLVKIHNGTGWVLEKIMG